jgi:hypothetical protein
MSTPNEFLASESKEAKERSEYERNGQLIA